MHRSHLALSLLAALVTTCLAGSAHVVNNCGTTLYLSSVKNNNNAPMRPLAAGGRYSEPFAVSNNGVSVKVSPSASGKVTQFEFTLTASSLFYDTSNIDGNPFAMNGTSLVPSQQSSSAFPSCVVVDCPPGQTCTAAYNRPNDVRTKVCPGTTDLVFTLCTQKKLSDGSSAGAAPAKALSAAAAATLVAATPYGGAPAAPTKPGNIAAVVSPVAGTSYSASVAPVHESGTAYGAPAPAPAAAYPQGKGQGTRRPRRAIVALIKSSR